ncbi:CBS domain-containing protein [Egibacter rhizosphaerae]|uniref:CBS domain-containing protein n=1 Tax=Egibacter rhizosphaerae TaxID=1670831 RepID=A0A411YJL4_9ACTN|nr:CBS domain-containing protein [Egibacter rhizosphaerae]QBI21342.1 CBS domain-containing protein [Egibacter rhizosphaerae]
MRRWLYTYRPLLEPPDRVETRLQHDIDALLRAATDSEESEPAADGSYPLRLSTRVAALEVDKAVRVSTGVAFHRGSRFVIPIDWHAEGAGFAFPSFEGSLEFQPTHADGGHLTLAGSYRTPLGPVGGFVDAVALHSVARETARRLLEGLAEALRETAPEGPPSAPAGLRRGEPLRVADVMTPDPITIDADLPVRTAALMLFHAAVSGAPVLGPDGELLGVLSERDLLAKEARERFALGPRAREEERRREARTAAEAATQPARVTAPGAQLSDVARELLDHDLSRLVVVDQGKVAGIVSRHDVLAALLREDDDIELAVRHVLDEHEAPDVRAWVEWGTVTLDGTAPARSVATELPAHVGAVDGVMDVRTEGLGWHVDDLVPYPPTF